MAKSTVKYQYETSPRKLEPNYMPKRKVAPKKKNVNAKKINKKTPQKRKTKKKEQLEIKTVKYIAIGFAIVFAIAYRNSKIDENFAKMQKLKTQLSEVEKQNVQLEISIENSMNLNNLEQQAKELLGMQKLSNKQTVYVDFPREDYIEPATEKIVIENNNSMLQRIKNWFNNL